jgi:uncharacterized protein YceK
MRKIVIVGIIIALAVTILMAGCTTTTTPTTPSFDPRKVSASVVYFDENGTPIRGLKMTDETFDFIAAGHDSAERSDIRRQVDEAEINYVRDYTIITYKYEYQIQNGILIGSGRHSI